MDVEEIRRLTFSWYDYTLFVIILGSSTLIGIYFGFFGNRQSSAVEYLKGGKKMSVLPIAMSQISSHISGILLLAVPADIYFYGTTYAWSLINIFWVAYVMPKIYLPVFYKMQLTSVYEYLEARFDKKLRTISSFLFLIASFLYLPIVIYVPALALSQAVEINVHIITPIVCAVCLFYTTIGGIKAVVWTDTLQFGAMIGGIVSVICIGLKTVGGFEEIYAKSKDGGRFQWDTTFTMLKRDTVWALSFGMSIHWMTNICINQGTIQKFLSLPTMKDIKRALAIFMAGEFLCKTSSILIGLLMYTRYYNCDPYTIGNVKKHDQMLPYFIMDIARDIPGVPGLFISGIFCAALSTLSAVMNSLGGTIYEDFVSPFMPKDITQKRVSNILKLIVFLTGIVSLALIFVVERLGGIFPLAISFAGFTGGPLLGIFTLGLLIPSANAKGALTGAIGSIVLMFCIFVPTQWYRYNGYLTYDKKPLDVSGCHGNYTIATKYVHQALEAEVPLSLFKLSPYFYTFLGALIVFVIGIPVSWWTRDPDHRVDPDLISPISQRFISNEKGNKIYYDVNTALKMTKETDNKDVRRT